jgi:cytochrome c-type biogenesis protein CcmH
MTWLRALLLALCLATPVVALSPDEILSDPLLEQRARDISAGLRCLVCQNQSIDDSDADLAKDLRVLVRERLVAGDSDEAVRQYLVDRYGEYVLLNPRVNGHTLLLWIAAPVLLLVGLGTLVVVGRKRRVADGGLSDEEQAALDELK